MEFADQLITIAQQEDIDPYWVHIEITETAILQDMKAAKAAVRRLRRLAFASTWTISGLAIQPKPFVPFSPGWIEGGCVVCEGHSDLCGGL